MFSFSQNKALKVKLRKVNSKAAQSTDALMWEKKNQLTQISISKNYETPGEILHDNTRGRNGWCKKWLSIYIQNFYFSLMFFRHLCFAQKLLEISWKCMEWRCYFSYNNSIRIFQLISINIKLLKNSTKCAPQGALFLIPVYCPS